MIKTPATQSHRLTTNADLRWTREMALAMTRTIMNELDPDNRFTGYLDGEEPEPRTEADAWICADDSGDYLSGACEALTFLSHYLTEGHLPRDDGWTLGAIRDATQANLDWTDSDDSDWTKDYWADLHPDTPEDIQIFIDALSTAL